MHDNDAVIVAARRTPIGGLGGALARVPATQLGSTALAACIGDAGLEPDAAEEVLMGCVLPAGLGQAPARQAALAAGVAEAVGCTTVNKMCGSGMKAIMLAVDRLRAGGGPVMLAGGMESMSGAPHLLPGARDGYRFGHRQVQDHMLFDGLQSPWDGQPMGRFADATAQRYGFGRAAQDAFAERSLLRARAAADAGHFDSEIVPVTVPSKRGEVRTDRDECPWSADPARIGELPPAFGPDGTVTAASASGIADGAAALALMTAAEARRRGLEPLARVVAHATHALAPEWFTTAPAGAVSGVLGRAGWSAGDVDLYEINEAFACVTMAAVAELGLDESRVNVNGGACALGHPIGATGARIVVTLVHAMRSRGLRRGVAALCIGGGEATALALEVDAAR